LWGDETATDSDGRVRCRRRQSFSGRTTTIHTQATQVTQAQIPYARVPVLTLPTADSFQSARALCWEPWEVHLGRSFGCSRKQKWYTILPDSSLRQPSEILSPPTSPVRFLRQDPQVNTNHLSLVERVRHQHLVLLVASSH